MIKVKTPKIKDMEEFINDVEICLDLPRKSLGSICPLRELLLRVYNTRKEPQDVVRVLKMWEIHTEEFTEESTKIELPTALWQQLNDID